MATEVTVAQAVVYQLSKFWNFYLNNLINLGVLRVAILNESSKLKVWIRNNSHFFALSLEPAYIQHTAISTKII
jgi:hypothetical protein